MAQQVYRGNLSAKDLPLVSDYWGRTVIIRGNDQDFNRQLYSSENPTKDVDVPQVYYLHNVMPTVEGFQSIGYTQILQGVVNVNTFIQIESIRDDLDHLAFLGITSDGKLYVNEGLNWSLKQFVGPNPNVTIAYVSGVTYIYVEGIGCFVYNFTTHTLTNQTLTALGDGVIGICASFGYLVAWTINAVAWSSLIDPTDFTPSLETGAGGGEVQGAKGPITVCVQHTQGFIVYTSENAIASIYSGNAQYPYNFRPIVSSGGVLTNQVIGYDANSGNQYVYSTSGLQLISTSATTTIFPEVTDFLSGRVFEDFDEVNLRFTQTQLVTTLLKKLNVVCDRYLVLSYGIAGYTHALVYDMALKRWGKLRIDHVQIVEFTLSSSIVTETARQSFGLLRADGSVIIVDFNQYLNSSNGVVVLGKFQYVRSRLIQLEEIILENVMNPATFSLHVFTSVDGKSNTTSKPTLYSQANKQGIWRTRNTGVNHSLVIMGGFYLESFVLAFNIHGKR